jgi:site-specific recombinase XerD
LDVMNEKDPSLLDFLYGDSAELARRTASRRLLAWDRAVAGWLAEIRKKYAPRSYRVAKRALSNFFSRSGKAPWETTEADVQAYVDWRKTKVQSGSTIGRDLMELNRFFLWCGGEGIDPVAGADFNPVGGIQRPRNQNRYHARLLSPGEARALLDAYRREGSNLSLRDHAITLALLRLGKAFKDIQHLKWGQLESDEEGAHWARWKEGKRERLDEDVFAAIQDYLLKSGRLETIRPEAYVFCPVKRGGEWGNAVGDWADFKPMSSLDLYNSLHRMGQAVGIPPEKLNARALRHTAMFLRWSTGASIAEMQVFSGGTSLRETRAYLRSLPTPHDDRPAGDGPQTAELPSRRPHTFTAWEKMTHGAYVKDQPPEQLRAILAENVTGMEAEMQGLQVLAERLTERLGRTDSYAEQEALSKPLMKVSKRLMEMQAAQRKLEKKSEASSILEDLDALYEKFVEQGSIAPQKTGEDSDEAANISPETTLKKSIAITRLVLRRSFCIAMESENAMEATRAADVYVECCGRLVRLLQAQKRGLEKGGAEEGLEEVRRSIDQALELVMKEMDIHL